MPDVSLETALLEVGAWLAIMADQPDATLVLIANDGRGRQGLVTLGQLRMLATGAAAYKRAEAYLSVHGWGQ